MKDMMNNNRNIETLGIFGNIDLLYNMLKFHENLAGHFREIMCISYKIRMSKI